MATADQLKALIKCHAAGDDARFYSVALQVAAREARSGHTRFARDLKDLVDSARANQRSMAGPTPVAQPRGELAALLSVAYPEERFADLSVERSIRGELDRVIHEYRQRDRLRAYGFEPLRRLLLVGNPGTGKTMTACALAGELHLPLFTVRLDGLITKYMGETAAKLRLIFDAIRETLGVYLFDEVDALAGARAQGNDVGEIRRVLNSFLQFLEQDRSDSLIIATSNLPNLLDHALFRRFDATIEYPMPTPEVAESVVKNRLTNLDIRSIEWREVAPIVVGLSHADITAAAERAAKEAILAGKTILTTED